MLQMNLYIHLSDANNMPVILSLEAVDAKVRRLAVSRAPARSLGGTVCIKQKVSPTRFGIIGLFFLPETKTMLST